MIAPAVPFIWYGNMSRRQIANICPIRLTLGRHHPIRLLARHINHVNSVRCHKKQLEAKINWIMRSATKQAVCQIKKKYTKQRQLKLIKSKEKHEVQRLTSTIMNLENMIKNTDKLDDLRAYFAQNQTLYSSRRMFSALCVHANK